MACTASSRLYPIPHHHHLQDKTVSHHHHGEGEGGGAAAHGQLSCSNAHDAHDASSLSFQTLPSDAETKAIQALYLTSPTTIESTSASSGNWWSPSSLYARIRYIRQVFHESPFAGMLVLTTIYLIAELAVSLITGSMALEADAFHMLSDVLALATSWYAQELSKKGASDEMTLGWGRAEVIGAMGNCAFLLGITVEIILGAIDRLLQYKNDNNTSNLEEGSGLVLLLGCAGLMLNLSGLFLFGGQHHHGYSHSHSGCPSSNGTSSGCSSSTTASNQQHQHQHQHHHHGYSHSSSGCPSSSTADKHHHYGNACPSSLSSAKSSSCASNHHHPAAQRQQQQQNHVCSNDRRRTSSNSSRGCLKYHHHHHHQEDLEAERELTTALLNAENGGNSSNDCCSGNSYHHHQHHASQEPPAAALEGDGCHRHHEPHHCQQQQQQYLAHHASEKAGGGEGGGGHYHQHANLNMQATFLHILGDALGSLGVIISALGIRYCKPLLGSYRFLLDPFCSLIIVGIILGTTLPVLSRSITILLNKVPANIDVSTLRKAILSLPGVLDVHSLHVWTPASSSQISAMVHVVVRGQATGGEEGGVIQEDVPTSIRRLMQVAGVNHVTIQREMVPESIAILLPAGAKYRCIQEIEDDIIHKKQGGLNCG